MLISHEAQGLFNLLNCAGPFSTEATGWLPSIQVITAFLQLEEKRNSNNTVTCLVLPHVKLLHVTG